MDEGVKRGYFQLEAAEGAPLDRLMLHGLHIEAGPAAVSVEHLELAWAEDCLLRGRSMHRPADRGRRERSPVPQRGEARRRVGGRRRGSVIAFPLPLVIRELALADVDIRLADGTRVRFDDFTSGAEAQGASFELAPTRLSGLHLILPLSPERDWHSAKPTVKSLFPLRRPSMRYRRSVALAGSGRRRRISRAWRPCRWQSASAERCPPSTCRWMSRCLSWPSRTSPGGAHDYRVRRIDLSPAASEHTVEVAPLEVTSLDVVSRLGACRAARRLSARVSPGNRPVVARSGFRSWPASA
ncbi:hypothetical protein DSL92_00010 [Billgrantia gudaonensis]|uniref:Uncharacterized protein n=1 Tax=Billgrantia gudaonensis TaxID=376427 RepID=A0A3S0QGJ1_9GAMM|nr:hypothetical protein DSL92_00010 [Halomonas gudaonensis]